VPRPRETGGSERVVRTPESWGACWLLVDERASSPGHHRAAGALGTGSPQSPKNVARANGGIWGTCGAPEVWPPGYSERWKRQVVASTYLARSANPEAHEKGSEGKAGPRGFIPRYRCLAIDPSAPEQTTRRDRTHDDLSYRRTPLRHHSHRPVLLRYATLRYVAPRDRGNMRGALCGVRACGSFLVASIDPSISPPHRPFFSAGCKALASFCDASHRRGMHRKAPRASDLVPPGQAREIDGKQTGSCCSCMHVSAEPAGSKSQHL
jgi:hypothetical protein